MNFEQDGFGLGQEFEGIRCLSNAEVAVILETTKKAAEQKDKSVSEVFEDTLAYAKRFSGYTDVVNDSGAVQSLKLELQNKEFEQINEETGELEKVELSDFELVSLLNLAPFDYDEAIELIPSLQNRFSKDDIDAILTIIHNATGRTKHV
mmetsp:Transcript_11380/g.14184  ORF Transcript_11380/g.14184 Transcript_11380/m.14184 type:complete len:150 (-) Transcript_11380:205-654(-)|eukprot:CAMPEP_0204831908 /NCGR_PEP_ID=MMETSP1346-20131115/12084_1 /ASSEMBLY_ACC=CAM_ASM_000771 /TAXON_ID=215587 /ORGANISM="Aplanochytrium stocchinoi, Strain GSBS06" /LENGTH=149 /DNA_ID=CAMNT_0051963345 /DNA_START=350 /DNA_END=799 /DNA_ORIENTATION=-